MTRTPKQNAEAVRAAGVPDALNRWVTMTDDEAELYEAHIRRLGRQSVNRKIKNPPKRWSASASGLGVPLGFLQQTGAKLVNTGDDTMSKKRKTITKAFKKKAAGAIKTARRNAIDATVQSFKNAAKGTKVVLLDRKVTKSDQLAEFLAHKGGRSIDAICAEFGWLKHSARAAISGLNKAVKDGGKGLNVKATRGDKGTIYEIEA